MSIRQDTRYRARMIRTMSRDNLTLTWNDVNPADVPWIPMSLVIPDIEVGGSEETPRNTPSYILGWAKGYKGFPDDVYPGARVEIADLGVFEFLSRPRWLHEHNDRDGWTVLANRLDWLYPITGMLQEQGGQDIEEIILSMWNESESQQTQSRFENMQGECPIEFNPHINRGVMVDNRLWKITSATRNYTGPRYELGLRSVQAES